MKIKNIQRFWSGRKKDYARLYRSVGDIERSHFAPKRQHLNDLEMQIIKLRDQVSAKKRLFQKVYKKDAASYLWSKFRSPEKRLMSLRKSISKMRAVLEQKQKDYKSQLEHYNNMVRAVSNKLYHKPNPDFSPISGKQKHISFVSRDRLSSGNSLEL